MDKYLVCTTQPNVLKGYETKVHLCEEPKWQHIQDMFWLTHQRKIIHRAIPCYGHYIQRANFWKKNTFFLRTSFKQFLFKICTNIHYMVLNCQHKRNFDFVYKSCQYVVLNSVTDITKKSTSNFTCSSWQCYSCESTCETLIL